jgi:hypothetical protein
MAPPTLHWLVKMFNHYNPRRAANPLVMAEVSAYFVTDTRNDPKKQYHAKVLFVCQDGARVYFYMNNETYTQFLNIEKANEAQPGQRGQLITSGMVAADPNEKMDAMSAANASEAYSHMHLPPQEDHKPESINQEYPRFNNKDYGKDKPVRVMATERHDIRLVNLATFAQIYGRAVKDGTASVAFVCSCKLGYFCPIVPSHIAEEFEYSEFLAQVEGASVVEFALPIFNSVLHRVSVSNHTVKDWEGRGTKNFAIKANVIPGLDDEEFIPHRSVIGGVATEFLIATRNNVRNQFMANTDAKRLFQSGIDDIIAYSGRSCRAKKHPGFGAQKIMSDFIRSAPPAPAEEFDALLRQRVWATVFTSLNYGFCYACARGQDTAFWSEIS